MLYEIANVVILPTTFNNQCNGAYVLSLQKNKASHLLNLKSENISKEKASAEVINIQSKNIDLKPSPYQLLSSRPTSAIETQLTKLLSQSSVKQKHSGNSASVVTHENSPSVESLGQKSFSETSILSQPRKKLSLSLRKDHFCDNAIATMEQNSPSFEADQQQSIEPNHNFTSPSILDNNVARNNSKCDICNKTYSSRCNLLKHVRNNHSELKICSGKIMCKESKCNFVCRALSQLRAHLQMKHNIPMEYEEKHFETLKGKKIPIYYFCLVI